MSMLPVENRAKSGSPHKSDRVLLAQLRRCAKQLGRTPGTKTFDTWLGRKGSQLLAMRFGSWAAACRAAGLEPNERPTGEAWGRSRYSNDDVFAAYRRIREFAGGPPTIREWDVLAVPGEPSCHTLRRRYGNSWVTFLQEMESRLPATPPSA